jgi:hypothetical protein
MLSLWDLAFLAQRDVLHSAVHHLLTYLVTSRFLTRDFFVTFPLKNGYILFRFIILTLNIHISVSTLTFLKSNLCCLQIIFYHNSSKVFFKKFKIYLIQVM